MGMPETAGNGYLPQEPIQVRKLLSPEGAGLTKALGDFFGPQVTVFIAPPTGDRISLRDPYGKTLLDGNRYGSHFPVENHPGITEPYVEVGGVNVTNGSMGLSTNGEVRTATFVLPSEGRVYKGAQIISEGEFVKVEPFDVTDGNAYITDKIRSLAAAGRTE